MHADPTITTIAMLAVFALAAGGVWTLVKRRDTKRGVLMLVAALVLFGNVLVWTWPLGTPQPSKTPDTLGTR